MLDEKGFLRPTYDEILEDMALKTKELFGNDINTEETSIIGKMLRVNAKKISDLWEDVEGSYFTAFIDTCKGLALDRIVVQLGLERGKVEPSTGKIKITGTAGYTVPLGFTIATEDNVQYITVEDCVLDDNGTGEAEITCIESGVKGNCVKGDISVIVNPDENVTSVTNETALTNGVEEESDYQLRTRARNSIGSRASSTINSIKGGLLSINGVIAVAIYENNTDTTDTMGIPSHSFKTYVYGGDNQEIGDMLFSKKPVGIGMIGDVEVSVKDVTGADHKIKFSRPVEITSYFNVNLSVNSSFPSDGMAQVKTAIVKYVGGLDSDNTVYSGLSMGEDVIYTKLISAVTSIEGIDDFSLTMSKDNASFGTGNIVVEGNEIAITDHDKITVVVSS